MSQQFRPSRRLALATMIVGLTGLEGCAKLFTEAPRPLFRLTAPTNFSGPLPHSDAQIVIATPYAPAGLDTQRIAIARSPTSLDYLADGDWTDRAPALVRTALIETFENSRAVAAVGPDSLDLHADFVVEGDLRHFEAVYDPPAAGATNSAAAPTAWASLAIKLVKIPEHKIMAETLLSARVAATANKTPEIVLAFNAAMANLGEQVVRWTLANASLPGPRR